MDFNSSARNKRSIPQAQCDKFCNRKCNLEDEFHDCVDAQLKCNCGSNDHIVLPLSIFFSMLVVFIFMFCFSIYAEKKGWIKPSWSPYGWFGYGNTMTVPAVVPVQMPVPSALPHHHHMHHMHNVHSIHDRHMGMGMGMSSPTMGHSMGFNGPNIGGGIGHQNHGFSTHF